MESVAGNIPTTALDAAATVSPPAAAGGPGVDLPTGIRTHQAVPVGVDDGLNPVAHLQFREHTGYVGFHRLFADTEFGGDLAVAAGIGQQDEDLVRRTATRIAAINSSGGSVFSRNPLAPACRARARLSSLS